MDQAGQADHQQKQAQEEAREGVVSDAVEAVEADGENESHDGAAHGRPKLRAHPVLSLPWCHLPPLAFSRRFTYIWVIGHVGRAG
jgi:hypothetical protein